MRLQTNKRNRIIQSSFLEFDSKDFIYLVKLILLYYAQIIHDIESMKYHFAVHFYKIKKAQQLNEMQVFNLQKIANTIEFPFSINNNIIVFDYAIRKNLLSSVRLFFRKYRLYSFKITDTIIVTDLTTQQFSNAHAAYTAFATSGLEVFLNLMMASLHLKKEVNSEHLDKYAQKFAKLSFSLKFAVYAEFSAMMNYLLTQSTYAAAFSGNGSDSRSKIQLGFEESVIQISKKGYATIDQVRKMNIIEFLDILLKEHIDIIVELKQNGMNKLEIAKVLKISMDELSKII